MDYQQKEALKQKATIAGIGFVAGGVAWWIVLAGAFGWVSAGTAQERVSDAVQAKVDQVLAPFCADRFMANKAAVAKFAKASADYDRDELVENTVAKVGDTKIDYNLSESCANTVKARLKSAARAPAKGAPSKG